MKKILFICFVLTTFNSCSNQNSSDNPVEPDNVNEYSIIFNNTYTILGEQYALGIINSDGTGLKKVGAGLICREFSVSTDGSIAVYNSNTINSSFITISNLKDMTDYQLTEIGNTYSTRVSPNGKYISYKKYGESGIFIVNIDGSNIHNLAIQYNLYYKWSPDSEGIVFSNETYSNSTIAYYIDKDGIHEPVETENPFVIYDSYELEFYNLSEFSRAGFSDLPDSVGISPYNFNKKRNKAFTVQHILENTRSIVPYLLGYDLDKKTEKVIINGNEAPFSTSISWSPNDVDIALFTQDGLEIVKVDGTRNNILSSNISPSILSSISHKWIARID